MKKVRETLKKYKFSIIVTLFIFGIIAVIGASAPEWSYLPESFGFGSDLTVTRELDGTGKVIKTIETEQSGKTLWDLLNVLIVPLALVVFGSWLQFQQEKQTRQQEQRERERAEEQERWEKVIAESSQREEALQSYFDRLSSLLLDKDLIAIALAAWEKESDVVDEHKVRLDVAKDLIRARTLSILRRLGNDAERKGNVIRFLIEARIIKELQLDFSDADLSGADLTSINLSGVNLSLVNLTGAILHGGRFINADLSGSKLINAVLEVANLQSADLRSAKLIGANLRAADLRRTKLSDADLSGSDLSGLPEQVFGADLSDADLSRANLSGANLSYVNLKNANLYGANLSEVNNLNEEQLGHAKLCHTKLPKWCSLDPDRDCQMLEMQ